jgi:phosphopantetheinyl transferase
VIYHATKLVGVDIECPTQRVLKVSKRFLNADEQHLFKGNLLKIQLAWSAKEALYKVFGKETVEFSTSMSIQDFEPSDCGEFSCQLIQKGMTCHLNYLVTNQYNLVYTIL